MSTKLYNGLKLKDPTEELYTVIPQIARSIKEVYKKESLKLVAEEIVRVFDDPILYKKVKESPNPNPIFLAESRWKEQQENYGRHHTLNDPLRFSIVFGKAKETGNILAYPYYQVTAYQKALEETELFEEYFYYNNSDKPEELTEKQWSQRAKEWDSIANEEGTFSDLPLWELPSKDPFTEAYFYNHSKLQIDFTELYKPKKRLERILLSFLVSNSSKIVNLEGYNVYSLVESARRIVNNFLAENYDSIAKPEQLPESFVFSLKEAPKPYEIPNDVKKELQEELTLKLS